MSNNEAITRTPNLALKILVCYHKPYTMPPLDDGILLPIQVRKALTDIDLHIQGDNELNGQPCDNISHKHDYYTELTGIYWAWKNLRKLYPDVKYVGWSHYRRFFAFDEQKYFATFIHKQESAIRNYRVNAEKVIKILESGRIIVHKRLVFPCTIGLQFCACHSSSDYRLVEATIKEKFPDYYDDFQYVMNNNNKLTSCCMFIMKYEDFEKYCEWLFSVLTEIEPVIISRYSNIPQNRVLGFIAERLMDVYIRKNRIRTKHLNVYFYGDTEVSKNPLRNFLSYIHRLLNTSKYNIAMFILNLNLNPISRFLKKVF